MFKYIVAVWGWFLIIGSVCGTIYGIVNGGGEDIAKAFILLIVGLFFINTYKEIE